MQFTGEATSVVVENNMIGLYYTKIGRLRQLSEPRLGQQAGIKKISDTCRKGYSCSMGEKNMSSATVQSNDTNVVRM